MNQGQPPPQVHVQVRPFLPEDVTIYFEWAERPHVKDVWFWPGFQPKEAILEKIGIKNGIDLPFTILVGDVPIGHIVCWDMHARNLKKPHVQDRYTGSPPGCYGIDMFIGESDYLGRGYGTEALKQLADLLFLQHGAARLFINPDPENIAACRCYAKAGFKVTEFGEEPIYGKYQQMELERGVWEAQSSSSRS